jgi:hypothetical protein
LKCSKSYSLQNVILPQDYFIHIQYISAKGRSTRNTNLTTIRSYSIPPSELLPAAMSFRYYNNEPTIADAFYLIKQLTSKYIKYKEHHSKKE